jgi:hypothetical protein
MVMGQFKHIHLPLMVGISLFIPLLLGYSLYVDLSDTVLLSSDMNLEDSGDEDSSTCQNGFQSFISPGSPDPLSPQVHFSRDSSLIPYPVMFITQKAPVLRC